jgi:stage II sporulation protein AA (anti-sigma F factor antagonist)
MLYPISARKRIQLFLFCIIKEEYMKTQIDYSKDTLYVKLNGDIDHHSAKYIREEIDRELYKYQPTTMIMDLSNVDFMDSSGLGLILGRYTKINMFGGVLKVANPSERIEEMLIMAGTDKLIPIEKGVKFI